MEALCAQPFGLGRQPSACCVKLLILGATKAFVAFLASLDWRSQRGPTHYVDTLLMMMNHPRSESDRLEAVCEVCRCLYAKDLLAAGDGNVSIRLADGRIAITPGGIRKVRVRPEDLAFLSPEGEVLSGKPSSERLMHLAIYAACPEARCVVHAHPPTAVAWTLARPELKELPNTGLPELILAAGRIPIAPYARPGTAAMGEVLKDLLPEHRLLVLARHGALCWGEDLEEALGGIERLEHVAKILKAAEELGGALPLPREEREALHRVRAGMGSRIR